MRAELALRVLREAAWAPFAVLALYAVVSQRGSNDTIDWFFHFLGGATAAFFFYRARGSLRDLLGPPRHLNRLLQSFGLACAVSVLWELGEFFIDETFGMRLQHTLYETMIDLTFDVIGALAALGALHLREWTLRS